jgi:hypothetical protein
MFVSLLQLSFHAGTNRPPISTYPLAYEGNEGGSSCLTARASDIMFAVSDDRERGESVGEFLDDFPADAAGYSGKRNGLLLAREFEPSR